MLNYQWCGKTVQARLPRTPILMAAVPARSPWKATWAPTPRPSSQSAALSDTPQPRTGASPIRKWARYLALCESEVFCDNGCTEPAKSPDLEISSHNLRTHSHLLISTGARYEYQRPGWPICRPPHRVHARATAETLTPPA
jgi:hypothetical protein